MIPKDNLNLENELVIEKFVKIFMVCRVVWSHLWFCKIFVIAWFRNHKKIWYHLKKVLKRFWHPALWFLRKVFFVQSFMVFKNFFLLKSSKAKKKHQKLCKKSGKNCIIGIFSKTAQNTGFFDTKMIIFGVVS